MNLRYRRALYLTFFLAFFIAAPLIALYATGYSWNFTKNRLEKTGILFIEATPKDALVTIDGKKTKETPARFNRLLPGVYTVSVYRDGFHSWEKELEVKSNLTTFAQNVTLFKNTLPTNDINKPITFFSASPDREKFIYATQSSTTETFYLKNTRSGQETEITSLNLSTYNAIEPLKWSPNNNKLLVRQTIGTFNKYLVIDTTNQDILDIFDITRFSFNIVKWDSQNSNQLYGLRQAVVQKIDLQEATTETVLAANLTDFHISGNTAYYIEEIGSEIFLNKQMISENPDDPEKIKIPSPSSFNILKSPSGLITLRDTNNDDLFILEESVFGDTEVAPHVVLQDKAKELRWSEDSQTLLFYTDFELATFSRQTQQKNLITRYGEVIEQAEWFSEPHYIIYQLGNDINAIEASIKEPHNVITLTSFSNAGPFALTSNEAEAYIVGSIGSQRGIFNLELK